MSAKKGFIFQGDAGGVGVSAHGLDQVNDSVFCQIQERGSSKWFAGYRGDVAVTGTKSAVVEVEGTYGNATERQEATAHLNLLNAPDVNTPDVAGITILVGNQNVVNVDDNTPLSRGYISLYE